MWQAICSLGVLVCFSISSLSQEALSKNGTFHFETSLVFFQSVAAVAAAAVALALWSPQHKIKPRAEPLELRAMGEWTLMIVAYYASHYFGLASLRHLSYPVHVTFKSCKAIPVALGERLLTTKRHGAAKTLGVVVMCLGAAAFLVGGSASSGSTRSTTALGVGLVSLALLADGVYAGSQVKLDRRCSSEFSLMFYMNAWQGLFSFCSAVATSELVAASRVVWEDPAIARALFAFLLSKSLGTIFVYKLLREAGTLVVATVTTLRKVTSVLVSVVVFRHSLSPLQWLALVAVFAHKHIGNTIHRIMLGRAAGRLEKKVD